MGEFDRQKRIEDEWSPSLTPLVHLKWPWEIDKVAEFKIISIYPTTKDVAETKRSQNLNQEMSF
jgi:hypothetical protein